MAIFSKKRKPENRASAPKKVAENKVAGSKTVVNNNKDAKAKVASLAGRNLAAVIKKTRTSEKAYYAAENNVYVFEVSMDATKHDIRDAIRANYNVTPRRINVVKQKPRLSVSAQRRRPVSVSGLKKAYVYLNSGDKIDLV